jgi:DNA-binding PadR family transcriptional regulator
LKGHLDLLILAALEGDPGHGYLIVERIKERSAGVEGRRRRVYRLTARGRRELGARRSEWSVFARAVEAVVA